MLQLWTALDKWDFTSATRAGFVVGGTLYLAPWNAFLFWSYLKWFINIISMQITRKNVTYNSTKANILLFVFYWLF